LSDIVYVEMPEVGDSFGKGEVFWRGGIRQGRLRLLFPVDRRDRGDQ
jgi:hypothetical protein